MKKLLFFLLLFSSVIFAQNFTIRSQSNHGSILSTDMWLMSNSAGVYTNLTYLQLRQALDDEAWTWTGIHTFEGAAIIDGSAGGRLALQSSQSPFYTGELSVTSGSTYMKFQSDTVMTWDQMLLQDNTSYGALTYYGVPTFFGTLVMQSDFRIANGTTPDAIGEFGVTGTSPYYATYFGTAVDTFATWKKLLEYPTLAGDNVMGGLVTYPPGNTQTAPTATWDVSGLQNVIVVGVQTAVTVTSITGATDGQVLYIVNGQEQNPDWVTIQDNTTINLRGSRDFVFDSQWQSLTLVYTLISAVGEWSEISRSHNTTEDLLNVDINGTLDVASTSTFQDAITQQEVLHNGYEGVTVNGSSVTLNGDSNHYEITLTGALGIQDFVVTSVQRGDIITMVNVSTYNWSWDEVGQSDVQMAGSFTMGQYDALTVMKISTGYVEVSRSDN